MMISYLISDSVMSEYGFGISAENPGYYWAEENGYIIVDFSTQKVSIVDQFGKLRERTFEEMANG